MGDVLKAAPAAHFGDGITDHFAIMAIDAQKAATARIDRRHTTAAWSKITQIFLAGAQRDFGGAAGCCLSSQKAMKRCSFRKAHRIGLADGRTIPPPVQQFTAGAATGAHTGKKCAMPAACASGTSTCEIVMPSSSASE